MFRFKPANAITTPGNTRGGAADEDADAEEERKRIIQVLFATPMRHFSPRRTGGGTLRVRVLGCQSPRLKQNTMTAASALIHLSKFLPSPRKPSNASNSSPPSPIIKHQFRASTSSNSARGSRAEPNATYFVEASLGSARGRTEARAATGTTRKGGELAFDGTQAWIRLFVPNEHDDALVLLRSVMGGEKAQQQQRRVLHLRILASSGNAGSNGADQLETALDLDELELDELELAPLEFNLPLVSRLDPHERDLGHLQIAVSFERLVVSSPTSPIAAAAAAVASLSPDLANTGEEDEASSGTAGLPSPPSHLHLIPPSTATTSGHHKSILLRNLLPSSEEEFESNRALIMVPSAAALLAAAASALTAHSREDAGKRAASFSPQQQQPPQQLELLLRRHSCPSFGSIAQEPATHNREQLAGLREGWRMWRLVDKTQYQPSHRAQDAAMVGERFLNREAASSFFDPEPASFAALNLPVWMQRITNTINPPPTQSLSRKPSASAMRSLWCREKTVLLTGGTSGIGREIGRELCARQVKRLILLCRNASTGRNQAREWTRKYKNIEVAVIPCDLSSMLETSRALAQVKLLLEDEGETLDALVLCAATISNGTSASTSSDPYIEESFAVNYMANYLIVHALLSTMNKRDARIIMAGCANSVLLTDHAFDLDKLQGPTTATATATTAQTGNTESTMRGINQYMRTKSMLSCFASELSAKLGASQYAGNLTCTVFYPGAVKSKLADKVLFSVNPTLAKLADAAYGLMEGILVRTPQQGAVLGVFLLSAPAVHNGKVYHSGFTGDVTDFSPHDAFGPALDREKCQKLWAITGKLLNQVLGKESKMPEYWELLRPERRLLATRAAIEEQQAAPRPLSLVWE